MSVAVPSTGDALRRAGRWRVAWAHVLVAFALIGVTAARGDTITLRGSSIGMRGVQIDDVRSGRVFYRDHRGRRQWRELDEVDTIGFDDLPQLNGAEKSLAEGDTDAALAAMLQSLVATIETDDELRRLWVHVRLLRLHVARDETVAAASHFASVVQLRDDPWWRFLEPNAPMTPTRIAVTAEAQRRLDAAAETVETEELRAVIRRLQERLRPVHAAAQETGDVAPTDETQSGYTLEQIRAGVPAGATGAAAPAQRPAPATPEPVALEPAPERSDRPARTEPESAPAAPPTPPGRLPSRPRSSGSGGGAGGLDSLEALLDAGDTDAAIAACERIAARPGSRSLPRFLNQYGRSLLLAERPRDAAIMFMRCALLFEDADEAAPSLVAAARIHVDVLDQPRAARRLLERAMLLAADRPDVVASARAMLDRLPTETSAP